MESPINPLCLAQIKMGLEKGKIILSSVSSREMMQYIVTKIKINQSIFSKEELSCNLSLLLRLGQCFKNIRIYSVSIEVSSLEKELLFTALSPHVKLSGYSLGYKYNMKVGCSSYE